MGKGINGGILERLGVTQQQLADLLGLSQPSVHRKLHGLREWNRAEINAVLEHLRSKDPSITYEQLFGGDPLAPSVATAEPEAVA